MKKHMKGKKIALLAGISTLCLTFPSFAGELVKDTEPGIATMMGPICRMNGIRKEMAIGISSVKTDMRSPESCREIWRVISWIRTALCIRM